MPDAMNILISVEGRYADSMLSGQKRVEFRRRAPRVAPGTKVWVYSKLPKGMVALAAYIKDIVTDSPARIWKSYGKHAGVTRAEFDEYFSRTDEASALVFHRVTALPSPVTLAELRRHSASFQPPQFYVRLRPESMALSLLESAMA